MSSGFNNSMDEYLEGRRRRKLFSVFKSDIMNKRTTISRDAASKLSELRDKMATQLKKASSPEEKPKRDISQEDIDDLLRQKGVIDRPARKIGKRAEEGDGWKEVSLEEFGVNKEGVKGGLIPIHVSAEIKDKSIDKKEPEAKKADSGQKDSDNVQAKYDERMIALMKKASDILFKKKEGSEPVNVPSFRREVLPASIRDSQPKAQNIVKSDDVTKKADPVLDISKKQEAKKSFLSKFIQVKVSSEPEKEEEDKNKEEQMKQEEERAVKDQMETEQRLKLEEQQHSVSSEEHVDFSSFFQEDEKVVAEPEHTEKEQEGDTEEQKKVRELMENLHESQDFG